MKQLKNTHYIFKDIPVRNEFGMIATLHNFGRDLKWNPHIHCLVPKLVYSLKTNKLKMFHHSISLGLEKHLMNSTYPGSWRINETRRKEQTL